VKGVGSGSSGSLLCGTGIKGIGGVAGVSRPGVSSTGTSSMLTASDGCAVALGCCTPAERTFDMAVTVASAASAAAEAERAASSTCIVESDAIAAGGALADGAPHVAEAMSGCHLSFGLTRRTAVPPPRPPGVIGTTRSGRILSTESRSFAFSILSN
jgi:hypothetical protein